MSTFAAPNEARPLQVVIDPKWSFELENFELPRFFEEAKVTQSCIQVLQGRFDKFCSKRASIQDGAFLSPSDFHCLNEHYALCKCEDEEHFFRAMDKSCNQRLSFEDFLMGCAAANPSTPHVLNSFTGYVRARYIFDFYNVSRSGTLDFEELAHMLVDSRRHVNEDSEAQRQHAVDMAQELGEVSVATLRISSISGELCEFRASTRWTGLRVRREIARLLQVPVEGQELLCGEEALGPETILESLIPQEGSTSRLDLVLAQTSWDRWPCPAAPAASDGLAGLERLVHVTFHSVHQALTTERLRGTSRLFRFNRSILYKRGNLGGA